MTYKQVIKYFGTVTAAASSLGYTRAAIYRWLSKGIPKRTQLLIESVTGGDLKANRR